MFATLFSTCKCEKMSASKKMSYIWRKIEGTGEEVGMRESKVGEDGEEEEEEEEEEGKEEEEKYQQHQKQEQKQEQTLENLKEGSALEYISLLYSLSQSLFSLLTPHRKEGGGMGRGVGRRMGRRGKEAKLGGGWKRSEEKE